MEQEQTPSIFDEMQQQNPVTYATTGQRFANFIVDLIVFYVVAVVLLIALSVVIPGLADALDDNSTGANLRDKVIFSILYALFYILIEGATKGKTLGKLISKTRAVREDGTPITWKDAFARSFSRIVPFDQLSGLSGHPWHDKWTKTIVVKEDRIKF